MIRLYGQKAEMIEDGSIFTAHVSSVEGRKVVTLIQTMANTNRIIRISRKIGMIEIENR